MAAAVVRPEALDYVAGLTLRPGQVDVAWDPVPHTARRLEHVAGVGVTQVAGPSGTLPTLALLSGLAAERIPLAFGVSGDAEAVRFTVGTWSRSSVHLDPQHAVLTSLLDGAHIGIERSRATVSAGPEVTLGGIVVGVPGAALGEEEAPWDRLVRSLQGSRFAVQVVAEPVEGSTIARLRDIALEDQRAATAAQGGVDQPVGRAYQAQLDELVASLGRAMTVGGWRVGVYLGGDTASYWQLCAAWQAAFTDEDRPLSPLQIARSPEAVALARDWALPYAPGPPGPRLWRHPFAHQSLLDSAQLATYCHFPRRDTPGFAVRPVPTFAVSRAAPADPARAITVGEVMRGRRRTGTHYRLDPDQLTRHAFVAGLTGSGKTNTIIHLLGQAAERDIPFLVIEPAKTEYRELLGRPALADRLRVFTLGREHVSPLRLNPFEVPPGTDVGTHLDLLKAVFTASFALWVPLPQILEQCLVDLYVERGWDFATGTHRGGSTSALPDVPTLAALVETVERAVPELGYKGESTQEITASLTTRLNSLRRGSRGLMLDVERSLPIAELLRDPTVIELEGLGDDADKAFVMGMLLISLYEHRRAQRTAQLTAAAAAGKPPPAPGSLSHVVVIEEAHRLLAAPTKQGDSWTADPQGAFAETFSHMLSEVRAYGQAIVIADQVPVRLAPDVLKNTNLKIAHRLVAGDDREAMAGTMSMDATQSAALASLPRGRAAVFSEGDHAPLLVAIEKAKDLGTATAVDDAAVARAMTAWRATPRIRPWFDGGALCAGVCEGPAQCRDSRGLAESPSGRLLGRRLFVTSTLESGGIDAAWPDVVAFVSARTPFHADRASRVHSFALHALQATITRRATQGAWPASAAGALAHAVRAVVAERAARREAFLGTTPARLELLDHARSLMHRPHDPYPLCPSICPDGSCRFRDPARDLLLHPRHAEFDGGEETPEHVAQVGEYAADDLVAVPANGPEVLRDELVTGWVRAASCASLVRFGGGDRSTRAVDRVAEAMTEAGWAAHLNPSHSPQHEEVP